VPPSTRREVQLAVAIGLIAIGALAIWIVARAGRAGTAASTEPSLAASTGRVSAAPAGSADHSPVAGSMPAPSSGPVATPTGVVLVGAGDIAACASQGDEATADLLDTLEGTVFTLGDNAYEKGTAGEFRRCYDPTWGRQRARTLPVPGNHDYGTAGATGYFGYFGAAAGDPSRGYHATDVGAWRVYALNSNCLAIGGCGAGSAQERWLRDDLASNPRACVLAIWHHPRFSSGPHGNDGATQALWQALYDAGAELVLNGHDHDYERFAPQNPTGQANPSRGIIEIVAGTGGRSHYQFLQIRANSLARNDTTYGVLRLVLSDGSWSAEFIPVRGGSFSDASGGTCH
jgi:acid phosphatase type 7